ncbi:MAG: pyrrolysine--tRNA(Pyl) ligase large subunit [Desulfosarcinaceae bacterium]|nr:pyrrolysine--tRNA(Pyl) ligase large subunit [Desulfosarcinaceae bacterium]
MTSWTDIQHRRLVELGAAEAVLQQAFSDDAARNNAFQKQVTALTRLGRGRLAQLRSTHRRPALCRLEHRLTEALTGLGFVQVSTPVLLSRGLLAKMGVTTDHPLNKQIYWVERDKCLRPMLAPHLYYVMKDLLRLWEKPVAIFEIGPCFRRESEGARHSSEFTMLNLCEFGLPEVQRRQRIENLADVIMAQAKITAYAFETETSAVYGTTVDVVAADGLELGSGAMGPHPLDRAWKITDTWVGIGFGLERLLMATEGGSHLSRHGRSLAYLDGVRLNI